MRGKGGREFWSTFQRLLRAQTATTPPWKGFKVPQRAPGGSGSGRVAEEKKSPAGAKFPLGFAANRGSGAACPGDASKLRVPAHRPLLRTGPGCLARVSSARWRPQYQALRTLQVLRARRCSLPAAGDHGLEASRRCLGAKMTPASVLWPKMLKPAVVLQALECFSGPVTRRETLLLSRRGCESASPYVCKTIC